MKRLGCGTLSDCKKQWVFFFFFVWEVYLVLSGSSVELILRAYLFCWFCCLMCFFNPLISWLPAPSPLCSLLEAARVTLVVGRGKSQYSLSLHALYPSSPLSCPYRADPHEGKNLFTLFIQCHRPEPQ